MKKTNAILGCFLLLLLNACTKEISSNNNFTPYTGNPLNDTAWVRTVTGDAAIYALADTIFQRNFFVDSFDLTKEAKLEYGDSLEVEIDANSFFAGTGGGPGGGGPGGPGGPGGTLDGKAKIEILRLQKKGDFIKAYRPNNSFGYPLETAGGFFIRVSKNGQELVLNPGSKVKINFSDIAEPVNNMQVFYGRETFPFPMGALDSAHTWIREVDTSWIKTFSKQTNTGYIKGYKLEASHLRWISAHRYMDSTVAKTNIYAILPPNFTNKNTQVFTVFNNNRTVLAMQSDIGSRSFMTGNIPLRSKITLVSISKIGLDLYLGTKVVNDVGTVINYSISPEKKTLAQILDYLNAL
ncbi:MAG: hypothetical protein K2Q21_06395 [Chitinophagaceae bacterium]|nr:hypothetical protein [Chitinophagaceae bacterium]